MTFRFEHRIPLPRATVFSFFESPAHLSLLHAGWSRLRLLKHEPCVRLGAETWVEHTIGGFVPVVLGFRHTVFEPPLRFAEELIHGPFSRFIHIHEFEENAAQTVIRDLIDVEWPWQFSGTLAMKRIVAPSLTKLFRCRQEALDRLARDGTLAACSAEKKPTC